MNITLDRIIALIKKLEEEHPEASNNVTFKIYDDLSGEFGYHGYQRDWDKVICDFQGYTGYESLGELLEKYGV